MRQGKIDDREQRLSVDDMEHLAQQIQAAGLPLVSIATTAARDTHYFNFHTDLQKGDWEQIEAMIAAYTPGTGAAAKAQAKSAYETEIAPVLLPEAQLAEIDSDLALLDRALLVSLLPLEARNIMKRQLIRERKALVAQRRLWKGRQS